MFLLNHVDNRDYEGIYTTPLCSSEDRAKLNQLRNTILKEAKEFNSILEKISNKDRKLYLLKRKELENKYSNLKLYNLFNLNIYFKNNVISLEIIEINSI